MINGTTATTILVLSLLGVLGFAGLLVLGVRMWGEERTRKRGVHSATQAATACEPDNAPEAKTEVPAVETAEPPAASTAEAAEIPPAGPALALPQDNLAPAQPAPELASPPISQSEGKIASLRLPFLNRGPSGEEILRVMRDPATGQANIFIGGKACTNYQDIQDPANKQAFMMAFQLLQAFSENALAAPPSNDEAEAALQLLEAPRPAPVAYRAAELPPPEVPSMQPLKQLQKLRGKQPPATKYVIKSITEQIEDQLQDKIARTPLARRGVHVRSEPQGNAIFMLEGKTYSTVEDVPDPEVRQVIREAISEWEKKK